MLEMLINPKKAERRPWEMFFIGAFYSSLSIFLVTWIFSNDPVLSKYSGILMVTFTVMFSIPFIYYTIRLEEKRITPRSGSLQLIWAHRRALFAFLFLFLGFVVAYSFLYIVMPNNYNFQAQIETYCQINRHSTFEDCTKQYGIVSSELSTSTGRATSGERFALIFINNMYVLLFTLIFSLIFGAGVIFILAWNASVIAAAVGIFTESKISSLPLGIARYIIHGAPEIAAYFIVALAGGLVSISVIKHEAGTQRFWEVLHDSLNLIILAIIVLFVAAMLEVYVTPLIF